MLVTTCDDPALMLMAKTRDQTRDEITLEPEFIVVAQPLN